jgi:hypothetical protein
LHTYHICCPAHLLDLIKQSYAFHSMHNDLVSDTFITKSCASVPVTLVWLCMSQLEKCWTEGKVKMSLCLPQRHTDSRCTAPVILKLGTRWRAAVNFVTCHFTLMQGAAGCHWLEAGWESQPDGCVTQEKNLLPLLIYQKPGMQDQY